MKKLLLAAVAALALATNVAHAEPEIDKTEAAIKSNIAALTVTICVVPKLDRKNSADQQYLHDAALTIGFMRETIKDDSALDEKAQKAVLEYHKKIGTPEFCEKYLPQFEAAVRILQESRRGERK